MKPISNLKYFYLAAFSKPACDRAIYRAIRKTKTTSILEIGIGNASRAENMIQVAKKYSGSGTVRYTGIDPFEAAANAAITLKDCHQRLNRLDAKLQLVPGEIYPSIHRIANSHTRTDLLIVSAGYEQDVLENIWYYVPRMLHATSIVFLQDPDDSNADFKKLARLEIERMAQKRPLRSANAA